MNGKGSKRRPRSKALTPAAFEENWNRVFHSSGKNGAVFSAQWSERAKEYIGLCTAYPSLSYFAPTRRQALAGITDLVATIRKWEVEEQE